VRTGKEGDEEGSTVVLAFYVSFSPYGARGRRAGGKLVKHALDWECYSELRVY